MKVLVTGHRGYLGSRLVKALGDYDVVGYDLANGQDILRSDQLSEAMVGCTHVAHLAGIPVPRRGDMKRYFEFNVEGTLNVLEAAMTAGVERLIYTSSTAYYGCNIAGKLFPKQFPIHEDQPPASIDGASKGRLEPYNQSKVMAEQLLAWYGTNHKLKVIVLRLAPANSKHDQYHGQDDWSRDRTWRRGAFFSNVHPDYAIQAMKLALESDGEFWYQAFNITDRYVHKSIDVLEWLEREYPDTPVDNSLGLHDSLVSPQKAIDMLGFEPCSDLE